MHNISIEENPISWIKNMKRIINHGENKVE